MMYDEYEAYSKKYQDEFGKDTVVLYQCGGFYEVYSIDDGLVDIKRIADVLDVQVSKRNKKDPEMNRANCLFLGWPLVALNKFLPILIEHNFTVVLVDQLGKKDNKNNKEIRQVSKIFSKGTFLDNIDGGADTCASAGGRFMICIYVEKCTSSQHGASIGMSKVSQFAIGVSIIEVSTGSSFYKEILPSPTDNLYTSDELYRITSRFPATELIITSSFHKDMLSADDIISCLKLNRNCHIIDRLNKMSTDITKSSRQNLLLSKVFPHTGMLSPIEFVNLERSHFARVSYVCLMEYLFTHNECIVIKLRSPEQVDREGDEGVSHDHNDNYNSSHSFSSSPLVLSYNAVDQLDISQGLLQALNKCQTLMGKRYFRDRLMNPTFDSRGLKQAYEKTGAFIFKGRQFIDGVRKELTNIYDLERLFRRVLMDKCSLNDIAHITQSLSILMNIFRQYDDIAQTNPIVIQYTEILSSYLTPLLSSSCSGCTNNSESTNDIESIEPVINKSLWESALNLDAFPIIKDFVRESDDIRANLKKCVDTLNAFCDDSFMNQSGQSCFFRLEKNDRDGYFMVCTAKRMGLVKAKLVGYTCDTFSFDDATVSVRGDGFKVIHPYLIESTHRLNDLAERIESETTLAIRQMMAHISENYHHMLEPICHEVNCLDFCSNNAHIAITKNYCCPTLISRERGEDGILGNVGGSEMTQNNNTIICTNLRHPLVEEADKNVAFVGNDVTIGPDNNLLLYGLNAAGKSTLMKSVAIAVIMAQAGMFVPASSFNLVPFRSLFTRITKGDDIKKHQSTFMVEMQELRSILKRADEHSLVIGDELCCGTESASAVGIVAAGLCSLTSKNRCSFVFTTHLHDLTDMSCIQDLMTHGRLQIYHLHVEYDPVSHVLVFDRKLRKGQGLRIYGIEVCRALQIDQEFIDLANDIRNEYTRKNKSDQTARTSSFHLFHEPKRSRYNSKQFITTCAICGSAADEVHHIQEQYKADNHGFIDSIHKNQLSNLVGLCGSCHDKVHDNQMSIIGYVMTSEGVKLDVKTEKTNQNEKIEINVEKIEDIVKKYRFEKKMSLKDISEMTHLSMYKIKKMVSQ